MKNTYLISKLLFVFALGFILTNCTTPASMEPVDVSSEIQSLNEEFRAAFKSGDPAAVAARYTEDGKLYPPNSEMMEGQAAITAYWQGAMDAGLTDADLTTISAHAYGDGECSIKCVKVKDKKNNFDL
jgi:ketosteroid isomerase-like protein